MPGEVYAIACAFCWATSSALIKSQVSKIPVVVLNALQAVPAALIFWGLLFFTGRGAQFLKLPLYAWGFLAGSTLMSLVIGDMLYFQSMKTIGLSRAMPLSATYPFFTMLLAWLFLDERLDWTIAGGAVLIAGGAYLIAFSKSATRSNPGQLTEKANLIGVALAILAALFWSVSTVLLRIGLEDVDVIIANVVRLSVLIVVLLPMAFTQVNVAQIRAYGRRALGIIFLSSVIGTTLGTFSFLSAIQRAGAARTSILAATTPLFGMVFSFFLQEKPSARTLLGTALTVLGIWSTVYQPG
ncbi:MAG: DMT family transporter [Anaerolineae bacterium]|nr:DMT family transporter [Anaerolineae bacterium]